MVKRKPKRRPLRVFGASLLTCEERGICRTGELPFEEQPADHEQNHEHEIVTQQKLK